MKKAFKITGIVIGILSLLFLAVWLCLYLYLGKAFEFAEAANRDDIPAMEKMIKDGYAPTKTYFGVDHLNFYIGSKAGKANTNNISINVIKLLLKYKNSPNSKINEGPSILHISLMLEEDELTKILLEAGADVNYITPPKRRSLSVVDVAMIFNKYHLLPLLESYGGKPNSIILPEGYSKASVCISNPKCKAKLTKQHSKIK